MMRPKKMSFFDVLYGQIHERKTSSSASIRCLPRKRFAAYFTFSLYSLFLYFFIVIKKYTFIYFFFKANTFKKYIFFSSFHI